MRENFSQDARSWLLVRAGGPLSTTRRLRDRVDNYEVAVARRMLRRLRSDRLDILYFGDSINYPFVADGDIRTTHRMLASRFNEVSLFASGGASHRAILWSAYLRLVELSDIRPLIIVDLVTRMYIDAWNYHPAYDYEAHAAVIEKIDPSRNRFPRAVIPKPSAEAFARYGERLHPTMHGNLTIAEYIRDMRKPGITPEELARLRYAYLHTALVPENGIGLDQLKKMAQTFSRLRCPVVAYQGPVCMATGTRLLGEGFRSIVERNMALVESTFLANGGSRCQVVRTGTAFEAHEFVDPDDGIEHLNGPGRQRLAALIGDAVRLRLDPR